MNILLNLGQGGVRLVRRRNSGGGDEMDCCSFSLYVCIGMELNE